MNHVSEVLAISNLTVGYGSGIAIRDVSLAVTGAECVTILGANGAGKSTLLKSLIGLVPPRSGEVLLDGRSVMGLRPYRLSRLGIAIVPEGRRIFPASVRDNLEAGRLASGAPASMVDWVVELFPVLGERMRTPALGLSGGEQQMLSIARALLTQPKVLLLDEPSMGLAPLVVATVMDSVRAVVSHGTSILMVEQNFEAARAVSDGIHIMSEGVLGERVRPADPRVDTFVREGYFGAAIADPREGEGQ